MCDVVLTLDAVTEPVQLLHGAGVTLQALGPTALLQGGHGERLLQRQHDLVHLSVRLVPKNKKVKCLHILNSTPANKSTSKNMNGFNSDERDCSSLGCLMDPHQSLVSTLEDVAHKLAAPAFIRLSTDEPEMVHMPYTLHTERRYPGFNGGFKCVHLITYYRDGFISIISQNYITNEFRS